MDVAVAFAVVGLFGAWVFVLVMLGGAVVRLVTFVHGLATRRPRPEGPSDVAL